MIIQIDPHQNTSPIYFISYFNTLEKKLRLIQVEKEQISEMKLVLEKGNYAGISVYEVNIEVAPYTANTEQLNIQDI